MLIQIHMLQNYAPSNLNRDDSGAPKDAVFGGFQRGRISSQAIKRSIRRSPIFEEAFKDEGLLSQRTRLLPEEVKKALEALGADVDAREAIAMRITEIGKRPGKEGEGDKASKGSESSEEAQKKLLRSQILVFLGDTEVQQVAEKLWALYQEKGAAGFARLKVEELEAAMQHAVPRSVDIAMFGRMTTSQAFEDVRAAVQVAHALSTNTVAPQFDYFTAVDDISGESGAGMIGTTEFNSNTYYKYFSIHWEKLVENLGGDKDVARKALSAFLEAASLVHPSGKQNSFAAHNPADFVLVEVMPRNIPISYANAFVRPISATRQGSLMDLSIQALCEYVTTVRESYSLEGARAYLALDQEEGRLPVAARQQNLATLQAWTATQIEGEGANG